MRVLLFDIETTPNIGYIWGKYEQDVIEYVKEWHILSFAYKWLGEKTVHSVSLPDFPDYKKNKGDDELLVRELWYLFDEADVIVAHNGDQFDIKKAHARFSAHKLGPTSPFKSVDTKKVAKRYFKYNSNKLDDLGNYLGLGRKIQTGGFELWKGCMAGDMKSWATMVKYNKQDVVLLEKVYLELRPWMTNHPSIALIEEIKDGCPNCGGNHLTRRGFSITRATKKQRLQCQGCGAWKVGKTLITQNQIDTQ